MTLQLGMDLLAKCVAEWQGQGVAGLDTNSLDAMRQRLNASISLCNALLEWEHGWLDVWSIPAPNKAVRPPDSWRPYLIRPDLLGAVFQVYHTTRFVDINVALSRVEQGGHFESPHKGSVLPLENNVRHFLSLAASITGRIFSGEAEKTAYAGFMVEGTLQLIANPSSKSPEPAGLKARAEQFAAVHQPNAASGTVGVGADFFGRLDEAGLVAQVGTFLQMQAQDELSDLCNLLRSVI